MLFSIKLDGRPLHTLFLKYSDLYKHKVLEFDITDKLAEAMDYR